MPIQLKNYTTRKRSITKPFAIAALLCATALGSAAHARDMYMGNIEFAFTKNSHHLVLRLCKSSSSLFTLHAHPDYDDSADMLKKIHKLRMKNDKPISLMVAGDLNHNKAEQDDYILKIVNYEVRGFKHCGLVSFLTSAELDLDAVEVRKTQYQALEKLIKQGQYKQANEKLKPVLAAFGHAYGKQDPNFILGQGETITPEMLLKTQAKLRLLALKEDIEQHEKRSQIIKKYQALPYLAAQLIVKKRYAQANKKLTAALAEIGDSYTPLADSVPADKTAAENSKQQLMVANKQAQQGKARAAAISRLRVFKTRLGLLKNK